MDETVSHASCHFSHVVPTEANGSLKGCELNGALNRIIVTQKWLKLEN